VHPKGTADLAEALAARPDEAEATPEEEPMATDEALPEMLDRTVEAFKDGWPVRWQELRLCPLEHGLEEMRRLMMQDRPEQSAKPPETPGGRPDVPPGQDEQPGNRPDVPPGQAKPDKDEPHPEHPIELPDE
jgi:hypothetical protein